MVVSEIGKHIIVVYSDYDPMNEAFYVKWRIEA